MRWPTHLVLLAVLPASPAACSSSGSTATGDAGADTDGSIVRDDASRRGDTAPLPDAGPAGDAGPGSRDASFAMSCVRNGSLTAPRPTAATVGPSAGATLALHTGDLVLDTDGQSVANLHVTGTLYLAANNVTATDLLVDGDVAINGAPMGNYFYPVKRNQRLVRVDAHGMYSYGLDTVSLDRCHVHGVDGTLAQLASLQDSNHLYPARGLVVTNSLFDGLVTVPAGSKHIEALHLMGVSNASFCNNVFDISTRDQNTWNQITAALTMETWNGVIDNVLFDNNSFFGASYYQVYLYATNMTVTNNKFTTFVSPAGVRSVVQYPPSAYAGTYPSFVQAGNTLDGAAYELPGGG